LTLALMRSHNFTDTIGQTTSSTAAATAINE
jgi:hypothetical protein